jgi:hemerythrin-like domain-containing protein
MEGLIPMPVINTTLASQLQKEHDYILEITVKIESLLKATSRQKQTVDWSSSLLESLSLLREHLERHFDFEETGGFMEEVVRVLPNVSQQVERLKSDHQIMMYEINDLYQRAEKLILYNGSVIKKIELDIKHFLQLLGDHEKKENQLVFRVFLDDVGMID